MATRPTTKQPIGSISWIANERSTIQQLREQDVEDFAFVARNDLEWLNEHMADIFERSHVDTAELLKTPRKLRGQSTPRTERKQIHPEQGREPLTNILDFNQPASKNTTENPFFTGYAVASLPSSKQLSPARGPSKSPARSLRVLQDAEVRKPAEHVTDRATSLKQGEASQTSVADSGIWNDFQSQQTQQPELPSQRMSFVVEITNDSRSGERSSTYRTAPEDCSDSPKPQSPVQTKDALISSPRDKKSSEIPEPVHQSPAKTVVSPKKAKKSAPEPRRSGRLAGRSSFSITNLQMQLDPVHSSVPPSSPPKVHPQEIPTVKEGEASTLPVAQSSVSSPAARTVRPQNPPNSPEQVVELAVQMPEAEGFSPSRSSSESPAPEIPVVRKSILNFASLPAREPLTNKKKSLGVKHTRDSHVEQVRLNSASRASWMNRKGNGKSLGASSKQIEPIEKEGNQEEEEGSIPKPEVPKNLKRKSETVRDDSRKKSKGNVDEVEDGGSSSETSKAVALHNKTSTQRLHDKIQQLGKFNASREARSFPSAVSQNSNLAYPDLSQTNVDTVRGLPASKRTKSDSQGQLPSTAIVSSWTGHVDGEEDWISVKTKPQRTLLKSYTEGTIDTQEPEPEKPVSARWNNSPKRVQQVPVRTMTTSESAPNPRSPTMIRLLSPSPLKESFSGDWIKAPASPTTKIPGEGTISAVKAHTSGVFKKAKEMLLKSSASSASAKIETMGPALQGGHNLHDQSKKDAGLGPQETTKQTEQLYPDLGSVLAKEIESPTSIRCLPVETLEETHQTTISKGFEAPGIVIGSIRESHQIRSSRSKDIRDDNPEVKQPAVKSQGGSKAVERAEREEKLRQAEEELWLAKEEQRKEREQQERKQQEEQLQKKQEEQLRQAEEELRRIQEQQRKYKEEQMHKENEESKRRQLKQEKEELKRRQQEELRRQQEEAIKAKEIPSSFQHEEDFTGEEGDDDGDDDPTEADLRVRIVSSAEPERPSSRLQKAGSMRFQKTRDTKPPQRPGTASKDQPKLKGGPVSISVGTASQREMQIQRSKPQAASTSTLVAALKQSFENPSLVNSSSQISLNSSASASSLRSSNQGGPSKQLKSLTAAANQLKKEQEEKERKLAAKREIERRRLENQRKLEEEARKARQRQALQSTQKTLARTPAVANLRQTSEEPEKGLDFKTSVNTKPASFKTAVKRAFQAEATEDQQQYRQAPTKPGASAYQQDAAKKLRTEEYDEHPYEMAPPIRHSVAKKEIIPKSVMPHGYAQASSQALSSAVPSMLRPPSKPGAPMPQVEGVKFSKDKIRFAHDTSVGPSVGTSVTPSTFKTPGSKSSSKMHMLKTPAGAKDSPIYQNGEHIELPDIPTDSDEDNDDHPPKDNFHVPPWAESPELRVLLTQQQTVNPEEIFGPMARLDMDAIFQNRTDRQAQVFRARTSSANWSGADKLTPAEISADQEARRKMIEQGGWKYQTPQ